MRNRRFGVELEFNSNGNGDEVVGDALTAAGFGRWVGEKSVRYDNWYNPPREYCLYSLIGHDGSEIELRSPILQGKAGFKELKGVVEVLNDLGCYTTASDGLHVHHDTPEFVDNKPLVVKMLKSWVENQDNISKFINPTRANRSYSPCAIITENHLWGIENAPDQPSYGYSMGNMLSSQIRQNLPRGNLNCQSLYEHGTIEFRYLEGTLDWDVIESWIKFGQGFLNGVVSRKNPIQKAETPVVLLNRLRANDKTKTTLATKAINHGYPLTTVGVI